MTQIHHKTIWLLLVAFVFQLQIVSAATKKNSGAEPAFDKGSNTLGLSIGLGLDYDDFYGDDVTRMPALNITLDHGTIANVGPGTIGIGGVYSFKRTTYRYSNDKYRESWTNNIFGVRGTYHLTILKDKNNKFDPYAGLTLGFRINSYRDTYYDDKSYNFNYVNGHPIYGVFAGAKYNFKKNFGAFAEVGYDISFLRLGINFNF